MARPKEPDPQQDYSIEPLGNHDRAAFSCGNEALDNYFKKQATQDAKKRAAVPYVLVEHATGRVVGYYTLSATAINLADLPPGVVKKLPRYPTVPATLLGRLAVDQNYQQKGLGEHLLIDALHRSWQTSKEVASVAVVVDPIDEGAVSFYEKHDFAAFGDDKRMYLRMETIEKSFKD